MILVTIIFFGLAFVAFFGMVQIETTDLVEEHFRAHVNMVLIVIAFISGFIALLTWGDDW